MSGLLFHGSISGLRPSNFQVLLQNLKEEEKKKDYIQPRRVIENSGSKGW